MRPAELAAEGREARRQVKLGTGEQGGAAAAGVCRPRAGETQRSECAVYKQGSATVGEPGSAAAAAAWSPAAGGRRGRERGWDHMGGGMASGEAPAKMANGFFGMQNEKPSA